MDSYGDRGERGSASTFPWDSLDILDLDKDRYIDSKIQHQTKLYGLKLHRLKGKD